MRNATCLALAAAMLLSGISVAAAAGSRKPSSSILSPCMPANGMSRSGTQSNGMPTNCTTNSGMPNNGTSNNRGSGSGMLNKGMPNSGASSGPNSGTSSSNGALNPSTSKRTGSGTTAPPTSQAQDTVSLDPRKRQTAWRDITGLALKEKAPSGFTPRVGVVVSSQLRTHPVPASTANKVPELRPYSYALLDSNQILIINPNDKKIAGIITR